MTEPDPRLQASQEALALLEGMMLRLYREKAKYHPTQYYAMMADSLVDQIRKVRADIDAYIGIKDFDVATQEFDRNRASSPANGAADVPATPAVHQ